MMTINWSVSTRINSLVQKQMWKIFYSDKFKNDPLVLNLKQWTCYFVRIFFLDFFPAIQTFGRKRGFNLNMKKEKKYLEQIGLWIFFWAKKKKKEYSVPYLSNPSKIVQFLTPVDRDWRFCISKLVKIKFWTLFEA